jgi:hypothetical protein
LLVFLGMIARIEIPESHRTTLDQTTNSSTGVQDTQETEAALKALASGELDRAAEAVANITGIVPAGDTCGTRRPNVMPPLSRHARTLFAAASIAASPELRIKLLDDLETKEPDAAWRIRVEKSEIARRRGDLSRAIAEAEVAISLVPQGTCASDAWFNKALASTGQSRSTALQVAVEHDPGHYNAWARLAVDLMSRLDHGVSPSECDTVTGRLVQAIVYLDKMAKTDAQLARLERLANNEARSTSPARAILLAMIMERTGRSSEAIDVYANLVSGYGTPCWAPIRLVAKSRLVALKESSL